MVLIQTNLSSFISIPFIIEFSVKKTCYAQKKDQNRRFLPYDNQEEPFNDFHLELDEPQRENDKEKTFENLSTDIQAKIPPLSSKESLHLNELFDEPEYQDNPLAIVIYQAPPLPPRMAMPTFPFPIPPQQGNQNLKNIPTVSLPKFYGLIIEDPETFLFEFNTLYRSYDYTIDVHKLKLFPSTLKEVTLRWFIGLGANVVENWTEMRNLFLQKYKEYCRG